MKKILVCEDEAAIRDFVVINLTRAGYDVVEADCGEAALQKYEENNGDFDVAILDVMMPGIDGFQVCKELRNRKIPIPKFYREHLPNLAGLQADRLSDRRLLRQQG